MYPKEIIKLEKYIVKYVHAEYVDIYWKPRYHRGDSVVFFQYYEKKYVHWGAVAYCSSAFSFSLYLAVANG